jgi:hypothetical protein
VHEEVEEVGAAHEESAVVNKAEGELGLDAPDVDQ